MDVVKTEGEPHLNTQSNMSGVAAHDHPAHFVLRKGQLVHNELVQQTIVSFML